jgi:hypothetical protein
MDGSSNGKKSYKAVDEVSEAVPTLPGQARCAVESFDRYRLCERQVQVAEEDGTYMVLYFYAWLDLMLQCFVSVLFGNREKVQNI